MGIIQSQLERRRERLLNQCETLNKNIFHLQTIENNTKKNLDIMEMKKNDYEKSFEKIEKVIKKRKQEYLKTKDVMECSICMERKVDCVLVPCGHLYCSQCIVGFEQCPHCRSVPKKIQKLFFT